MMRRSLSLFLLTAGALVAPAVGAPAAGQAPTAKNVGLSVRLAEAPAARASDPRAAQYVVDHLKPGATIRRKVEVTNNTDGPKKVRVYGGGATIAGGAFTPDDDGETGSWIKTAPGDLDLKAGQAATVTATIAVPAKASAGERYGVIWAELPGVVNASGVTEVNRVGVRVYLSVGPGGEPESDFVIESLAPGRTDDGRPTVSAVVRNTGGRALDMVGTLTLSDGPGGLTAGPFPATVGTTLGVREQAPVRVVLDKAIPVGPWEARIALQSGTLEREAKATITFPTELGRLDTPVKATEIERKKRWLVPIALGLLLLVLLGLFLVLWKRRRDRRSDH